MITLKIKYEVFILHVAACLLQSSIFNFALVGSLSHSFEQASFFLHTAFDSWSEFAVLAFDIRAPCMGISVKPFFIVNQQIFIVSIFPLRYSSKFIPFSVTKDQSTVQILFWTEIVPYVLLIPRPRIQS